jgi:hypothetical protein
MGVKVPLFFGLLFGASLAFLFGALFSFWLIFSMEVPLIFGALMHLCYPGARWPPDPQSRARLGSPAGQSDTEAQGQSL